ncbi:MAG: PAS domain S-box protein [Aquabacterium sp.]|jgi:PAS domain S-box-containing protein|nr:MAG: PAS domain S-box protein [Aquabacterium sp.]
MRSPFGSPPRPGPRPAAGADVPLPPDAWELWFDSIPAGLAWLDARGTLLRANTRFRALTGWHEGALPQAEPDVQQLFGWGLGGAWPPIVPGAADGYTNVARLGLPDGSQPSLRLKLQALRSGGWHPDRLASSGTTYLCTVEDLSAAEERDLARLQLGALMNAASVGLATFEGNTPSHVPPPVPSEAPAPVVVEAGRPAQSMALQSVSRDMVVPQSLESFARVQTAVKRGEATQARYAIRHPDLGTRWLLTRVEPGRTGTGHQATSVVTIDVTDEQLARDHNEQLLRELATILESSPAGIAYLKGTFLVRCNSQFELMLGLDPGSAAGRDMSAVLATVPQGPLLLQSALDALHEAETYETEIEIILPDRRRGWYALKSRRLGPPVDDVEAVAVLSDITRRKSQQLEMAEISAQRERAQLAADTQAERTRTVLDSVFVGIVTVGRNGIEWMNRSARRMFGGDLSDFTGLAISTVATEEEDHPFRHLLDDLSEGQAHTFECRVKARDGRLFWVVGNAVVTRNNAGEREVTYALLDIERRREAEARTAEAQASLQRIIESAPLAITLRDAKTLRVLQMNQVAASITGIPRDQAIGLLPEDLYPDDATAATMRADMVAALADSQPTQREYRLDLDGHASWWEARYLPLARPGCPPDQLLLVATDVTDQRLAQKAKLEDAIAQREKLVREVHHRIKNNLQGVAGLLQQIALNKPEMAETINEVVGQVQAIAQVYGLQVGSAGPLQVRSVIEAIAQSVRRTFNAQIALTMEGEQAHEWLLPEAESIPIALCVNELLTNAIKHATDNDARCTLRCTENSVDIQIHNHGKLPDGFSLDRIPGGVTGLGLVRALLPRRSASLKLEPSADGVIATVRLVPPGVARPAPGAAPQESTGKQITLWPQ